MLGVKSGAAAHTGSSNSLLIYRVGNIAGRKYALYISGRRIILDLDISGLIEVNLAGKDVCSRFMADGKEEAVDGDILNIIYARGGLGGDFCPLENVLDRKSVV